MALEEALFEKTMTKLSEAENILLSLFASNFVSSIALLRWKYGRKKRDREYYGGYTTRFLRGRRQKHNDALVYVSSLNCGSEKSVIGEMRKEGRKINWAGVFMFIF